LFQNLSQKSTDNSESAKFEVFKVALMKIHMFCNVMQCQLLKSYRHIWGG